MEEEGERPEFPLAAAAPLEQRLRAEPVPIHTVTPVRESEMRIRRPAPVSGPHVLLISSE